MSQENRRKEERVEGPRSCLLKFPEKERRRNSFHGKKSAKCLCSHKTEKPFHRPKLKFRVKPEQDSGLSGAGGTPALRIKFRPSFI